MTTESSSNNFAARSKGDLWPAPAAASVAATPCPHSCACWGRGTHTAPGIRLGRALRGCHSAATVLDLLPPPPPPAAPHVCFRPASPPRISLHWPGFSWTLPSVPFFFFFLLLISICIFSLNKQTKNLILWRTVFLDPESLSRELSNKRVIWGPWTKRLMG